MDGAPSVIEVDRLRRTFTVGRRHRRRTIEAVTGIDFSVDGGERLAFIGPNGAGKSTSIKMLTGLLHPTGGSARVLGLVPWDQRLTLTRRIGALFGQRSQLWHELPPRDGYRMLGAIHGLDAPVLDARVAELGDRFSATELFDQPVRTLSLGQRMRCELVACLLHRPDIVFLDEPTIGLDLVGKQQFREMLIDLNETLGVTVFLTSHDVADVEHVAQRAVVVNHGEIIHDDTVAAMRRSLLRTKRIDVTFDHAIDTAELARRLARELGAGVTMTGAGARTRPKAGAGPRPETGAGPIPERGPDRLVASATATVEVDTGRHRIRTVLDQILVDGRVVDLTVVDPPLEQVIGEIYRRPTTGDRP